MKVEYIDHMGNDLSVIRAATASFAKDPVEWDETKHPRLINYLARGMTEQEYQIMITDIASCGYKYYHDEMDNDRYRDAIIELVEQYRRTPTHWSPFAHTAIKLRLQAPIAIHAQAMKHNVGFAHNTVSRRYVSDTPELFVSEFREAPAGNIKQGSGDTHSDNNQWKIDYKHSCHKMIDLYNQMIEEGISPEQARFVLPQGVMTEWVSTGSLYAWARFYNQRADPHAQKEIQELADMVGKIIEPLYPVSWRALTRGANETI